MIKQRFAVSGMTCVACSSRVERVVGRLPGVESIQVNLFTNTMIVDYNPGTVDSGAIINAVEKAGYGARLIPGETDGQYVQPAMFIGDTQTVCDMTEGACHTEDTNRAEDTDHAHDADHTRDTGRAHDTDHTQDAVHAHETGHSDAASAHGAQSAASARVKQLEAIVANPHIWEEREKAERQMKDRASGELTSMLRRLIVSACFLLPLMYIAMGHMIGLPIPPALSGHDNAFLFALAQFLLCLPIIRVNEKFFTAGFSALVKGAPNMDSLIAVGSSAAVAYGLIALFMTDHNPDLYFESAAMILTLITLGKYLEAKTKGRAGQAIARLLDLAPETAIVVRDDKEYEIPVGFVQRGDIIALRPGAKTPVDGIVTRGTSSMDESALTGESMPVEKGPGDAVSAATINKAGFLLIKAERVGADTTLARIIRLVEEAGASKAPISRLADRVAGIFVPVVLAISVLTATAWLLAGKPLEFALSNAIAVLVISCPCALGLATPAAIMAGTGRGADLGILIKSAEALEKAGAVDTVVFDKTGTVTEGKPRVTDIVDFSGADSRYILELAVALEKPSEHPLAEAVIEAGGREGVTPRDAEDFQAVFGMGVEGVIGGKRYWAGNERMMARNGTTLTGQADIASKLASEGKTTMYIADENGCLGIIAIADEIKRNSAKAVQVLKSMDIEAVLLTGDNTVTARAVGKRLGIDNVIAEVLPEDKDKTILALGQAGRKTAMIGDGVNDAPALVRADVGIAIAAGTNVAIESADIVLMKSDPLDAVAAIRLSRAVIRNIRQNLFWAFFYNICGIPLAAGLFYGWLGLRLSPMFAAAAMSASSVSVVSNALRLNFFKPDIPESDVPEPDAPTPDAPTPDAPSTDAPDEPTPDALTPDALTLDTPAPDALTPDTPAPDIPELDTTESDVPAPEAR